MDVAEDLAQPEKRCGATGLPGLTVEHRSGRGAGGSPVSLPAARRSRAVLGGVPGAGVAGEGVAEVVHGPCRALLDICVTRFRAARGSPTAAEVTLRLAPRNCLSCNRPVCCHTR